MIEPVRMLRRWRKRLRALVRTEAVDRELDEELAFHLEMATEKLVQRCVGWKPSPYFSYRIRPSCSTMIPAACCAVRKLSSAATVVSSNAVPVGSARTLAAGATSMPAK